MSHPTSTAAFHAGRRRLAWLGAAAAVALLVASSCGGDDDSGGGGETVELTVGLFGDFGFEALYEEYEATHPNVEITERLVEFADHHSRLIANLATDTGAADIEAVEVGYIGTMLATPDRFYDLREYGAEELESQYLDWKWQQGVAEDGTIIGLGTDVGGLAMCYRRDLFEQAGLPSERDAVSQRWPTWDDYIETGVEFTAAEVPNAKFVDAPGEIFRAMVNQAPMGLYDDEDNIVVDSNPDVRQAWDRSVEMIESEFSAALEAFSPPWNTGFAQGSFATVICPAWMTSYIQEQAPDAEGQWDVAAVPGGSGNSGGSHLVLPSQGDHPDEAADLLEFLVSEESQATVFMETGNFPSRPALYEDPAIQDFTKPYFGDAPLGQIYSEAARALEPQHIGPREAEVRLAITDGLQRVEQGRQSPDDAWQQVLDDVASIE